MISRGDKITVLHVTHKNPVQGVVTVVDTRSRKGNRLEHAYVDWRPTEAVSPHFVVHLLSEFSEGWIWVRGHGEEQKRALLVARSLR